jgi:DHA2 family multidrug resistance protein
MELKDLFYAWVPVWVRLPVLFLLFFAVLTCNGVYLGNTTDMYSGLGVYPEPFTEAANAIFIGMGIGILIVVRLKRRFSNKTLLLYGLTMLLLMNFVCMISSNPGIVVAACLILGFCKIAAFIEVYLIWVYIWSKSFDRARVYPFLYFTALPGTYLITWVTTKLAYTYNWRYAYIAVLMLILLCILLSLIFVENHPLKRIYPLYQMDVLGILYLLSTLLLVNYIAVYGKVEDWFQSNRITGACLLLPIAFFAFIRREMRVKRPLVPFRILRSPAFHKGLFFFIVLGVFLPASIQSSFTGGILRFEAYRNTEINLYLIPAMFVGAVFSFLWYFYKKDPDVLLFTGFLAFTIYYFLLYQRFATGLGLEDFWLPSLMKGLAIILLYVCIGLYTVASFKPPDLFTAAGFMVITRSFLGSGIFTGLYSYFIYAGTVRHIDRLADLTTTGDYVQTDPPAAYLRTIQQQASLAAFKELTGWILLFGMLLLACLAIGVIFRALIRKDRILNQ